MFDCKVQKKRPFWPMERLSLIPNFLLLFPQVHTVELLQEVDSVRLFFLGGKIRCIHTLSSISVKIHDRHRCRSNRRWLSRCCLRPSIQSIRQGFWGWITDFLGARYNLLIGPPLVEEGDRIAQLIIERIYTPEVLEVDVRLLVLKCPIHQAEHVFRILMRPFVEQVASVRQVVMGRCLQLQPRRLFPYSLHH